MKTILATTMILALAMPAVAEEETLIGDDTEFGWFVAPMAKISPLDGDFGFLTGGRGGLIINHNLSLGGGGVGLKTTSVGRRVTGPGETARMTLVYGGFIAEYDFNPQHLTHASIVMLLGYGEANLEFNGPGYKYIDDALADGFFVVEPGVDYTINLTSFARLGAGASYRFVSGVERHGLTNGDIAGPVVSATLRFGSF